MSTKKKVTPAVDAFIAAHYGSMSIRDIATATGVSKSTVHRRIREMDLSSPTHKVVVDVREAKTALGSTPDNLSRLEELRDILHEAITMAGGAGLAGLSREYREVLSAIDAQGRDEPDEADGDPIAAILKGLE